MEQRNFQLESEKERLTRDLQSAEKLVEDLRRQTESLQIQVRQLETDIRQTKEECKDILRKWSIEKIRLEEENQRWMSIAHDRLIENERIASSQGMLLVKLTLAYAEVERLSART